MKKMPRSKATVTSTDSSSSSSGSSTILSLSDIKMGLDNKQRDIIMMDLAATRKKLEEENRILRDELEEANLTIRFLKYKLVDLARNKHIGGSSAGSSSGVIGWLRNNHEAKITQKDIRKFEKEVHQKFSSKKRVQSTSKDAFKNPSGPGRKAFTVTSSPDMAQQDGSKPAMTKARKNKPCPGDQPSSDETCRPPVSTCTHSNRRPVKITQATDVLPTSSVMDRLALSIIAEHSRLDDRLFLDNESDF